MKTCEKPLQGRQKKVEREAKCAFHFSFVKLVWQFALSLNNRNVVAR